MRVRALVFGLALLALSAASGAQALLDRDYALLKPAQRPDSAGKIEVIEFFSYGCPHCADLHPRVTAWVAKLPKDAVFKRIPVGFGRAAWSSLAKAYYALEATGDVEKIDGPLYDAIHKQGLQLSDAASITAWVAKHGVDRAKFTAAYNSFSVNNKVLQAEEMTRRYQVSAVPTFTVAGRYVVIGRSEEQMLATADELIVRSRKEAVAGR